MLQQLPSSPLCSVQHCTHNHSAGSVDDWDQQCKWSWSGLYLIAHDHHVFPAIWSRLNADRDQTDCEWLAPIMLRNKKNYLHTLYISDIYLATAGHSIQNKHIQYTSHMPTQVFCVAQCTTTCVNRYSYRYRRWKKVSGIGSIGKSWYQSQPSLKYWNIWRLSVPVNGDKYCLIVCV